MQFEDYNWHDNPIHGFKISESEYGLGDLVLDIDYITEWICDGQNKCTFKIAPATLVFHDICDLQISIDYKSCTAGITPPAIHEIIRKSIQYKNGYESFEWHIVINWPTNAYIKFCGSTFTQELRKDPIETDEQVLSKNQRNT